VNLLSFVPSLGTGEVVGLGEGMPLPARLTFSKLPANLVPASEAAGKKTDHNMSRSELVRHAIERWRKAATSQTTDEEDHPREQAPSVAVAQDAIARGLQAVAGDRPAAEPRRVALDPSRYSILKR
jgi:hypothetical protein